MLAALAECDHIIHAGDIGDPGILRALEALAPVDAVLGNNDFDEYGARVQRFARPVVGGVRFLVAHYPRDVHIGFAGGSGILRAIGSGARGLAPDSTPGISPGLAPGDPVPQVCVHGHTHVPEIIRGKQANPADYIICPGSPTRPRGGSRPSIAKLVIAFDQDARTTQSSPRGRVADAFIEEL